MCGTIGAVPYFIMILVAVAALAVLVGVVYVVLGKGGGLARFEADFPPLDLPDGRPVGSRDLSGLLLPLSLWGYHVRAVDALLVRLTSTLREREERIADLEWRLARLDPSYVPQGTGPAPGAHLPGDFPESVEEITPKGEDANVERAAEAESTEPEADRVEAPVDPAEYAPEEDGATVGGGRGEERP